MLVLFIRRVGRWAGSLALLVLLLAVPTAAGAQDIIVDLSGNELPGQVLEITPTQVVYRTPDTDPALPASVLDKRTLFMVRFANGTKEVFGGTAAATATGAAPAPALAPAPAPALAPASATTLTASDLYKFGKRDALAYHSYTGAFWGPLAATALTFYGGPLVAIGVALKRPRAVDNYQLDRAMLQYPAYVDGYERQAHRRKIGEAAKGVGTGLGVLVISALVLIAGFTR